MKKQQQSNQKHLSYSNLHLYLDMTKESLQFPLFDY